MSINSLEQAILRDKRRFVKAIQGSRESLFVKAKVLEGAIVKTYYSGGSGLNRRTGAAARGWQVKKSDKNSVAIVNHVPYADHSKKRTIKPKKGKYLAIPVGAALTSAGVSRFEGPKDNALPDLTLLPSKKGGFVLISEEKNEIYFVLKKKVVLPARTAGMDGFVSRSANLIGRRIGDEIYKEIR